MSVAAGIETAAAVLLDVAEQLGTRVTVERRPDPKHAAPVNEDLTVDDTWDPVTPPDRPAIVVVGGTNGTGLPMEGGPRPGEWAVTLPAPWTDVQPGDRLTVVSVKAGDATAARLLGRQAMVAEVADTSAAVAALVTARET